MRGVGSGPLDVPGSTFETDATVRAQVDPIVGDPVDGAAQPDRLTGPSHRPKTLVCPLPRPA